LTTGRKATNIVVLIAANHSLTYLFDVETPFLFHLEARSPYPWHTETFSPTRVSSYATSVHGLETTYLEMLHVGHAVGEKLAIKYENCDLRESASFYGAVEILQQL
jgi:hypothetical protein